MVKVMLGKIFKKQEMLQEYVGELKITYQNYMLTVMNYKNIYSIDKNEVILEEINVIGEELRITYQDKVKITIKGNISNVIKKG